MASQLKRKKDDDDDGENVSRTGRQRKKSAKVLEMEAEAEELALVLRARVEAPTTPRPRPTIPKGPRIKKTPAKAELTPIEDDMDDMDEEEETSPTVVADAQSKSGRVRKKSAKLMEMVEAEELDRKIFRTSHIPKSFRTAVNPSPAMPGKKGKVKIPAATATSPVRSAEPSSSSPPGLSPSAIKLLLSSPSKKTPATSNQPEPILSMLGASLAAPTKSVPQPQFVKTEPAEVTILPEGTDLGALATAAALASPTKDDKDFQVKFLQDCPDAVVNTKPVVKKRSKKQATPTPSAPALEKPAVISPGSSPKTMPKLKNLLSPAKKLPTMAANMADQPLLSKMMGEVGQIGPPPPSSAEAKNMKKLLGEVGRIGPPPPSSAEARNMKKRARKEAAAALKNQTEGVLKKFSPPQIPTTVRHFAMPKVSFGMPQLQPALGLPMLSPFDDDSNNEDDEQDQLMIDTTKVQKKKKVVKKEKLIKPKPVKVEPVVPELELVITPRVEVEQEVGMLVEEVVGLHDEEDEDFDNELPDDDEDDDDGEDVDVEVPSYANTNFMATKVQTSTEKKASKDKKKKKGKKDDPEKQKKKRGPTAYMLWCNAHRAKLVKDNPGIDFATISRRLGEMWSGQTDKDKMTWKKKAKKLASKGSTIISTGKGVSQMVHGGSGATLLNKPAAHAKGAKAGGTTVSPQVSRAIAAATAVAQQQRIEQDQVASPLRSSGCTPLDIAAHLKLLGESLSIIGARLQEHHGQIAVQGTLPVLLDSLLCALGPLACLTTNVPQLDGAPLQTHANTLDHIAYIMPGIG